EQLGAPVALISARLGAGLDQVFDFLMGAMPKPQPKLLPILQDVPKCREWAGAVGSRAAYRPPVAPKGTRRLDRVFLHPVGGPIIFLLVVVAVIRTIFMASEPMTAAAQRAFEVSGNWVAATLPEGLLRSLLVEGVWRGVGSVLVFLPQV